MSRFLSRGGIARSALTLAVASIAGTAMPAVHASTNATFTLVSGTLSVTEPTALALGSTTSSSQGASLSGHLGLTTVSDQRGSLAGWSDAIATTGFSDNATPTPHTIGANKVRAYVALGDGPTVTSGIAVPTTLFTTAATALTLSTSPQPFVTATATGSNTVTFNPTVTVTLDSTVVAGNYTGTITQSVS